MKTKQIITVCLLAAFLAGFGLWSVIRTPDAVSQAERRPLAQRPAFTAAGKPEKRQLYRGDGGLFCRPVPSAGAAADPALSGVL